jgi:HAD superfamily hydrolase (TIGR01662 family)
MKAVFIDRDGTIGGGDEVTFPDTFQLYPFSQRAIHILKEHHYKVLAFTNQPDISAGKAEYQDFEKALFSFGFDDICICPHQPAEHCKCRKPSTYMIDQMVEKYHLERSDCFVVGDRWSDMLAGANAGMGVILVKTGAGNESQGLHSDKWNPDKAEYIADNLLDAAQWIVSHR